MYDYLTEELPQLVYSLILNFSGKESIMDPFDGRTRPGGDPDWRQNAAPFALPYLNPSGFAEGQKPSPTAYLGSDEKDWTAGYDQLDRTKPYSSSHPCSGTDNFYDVQLNEEAFLQAGVASELPKTRRLRSQLLYDCFLYRRTSAIS